MVFYTADSGLLRPNSNVANTFAGILLGQGANAGSAANGTWTVDTGSNALSGRVRRGACLGHVAAGSQRGRRLNSNREAVHDRGSHP